VRFLNDIFSNLIITQYMGVGKMADYVDRLIKDFVTGRLDVMIKARRLELSARKPPENIGGGRVPNNTAPQEILIIKFDEDKVLRQLETQKEMLNLWWGCENPDTKIIISMKYKQGLCWYQIAQQLFIGESTARLKYQGFKDMIYSYV
jgi:RinA family phage transcriptional activator